MIVVSRNHILVLPDLRKGAGGRPSSWVPLAACAGIVGAALPYLAGCDGATIAASACLAALCARVMESDVRRRMLFDTDLIAIALVGAAWTLSSSRDPVGDLLAVTIHSCAYALGFWAVGWIYRVTRGRHGLGLADVKLAAALGPLLDVFGLGLALVGAAGLGLVYLAWRRLIQGRRASRYTFLPFGGLLAVAAYVVWLGEGPLFGLPNNT